MNRASLSLFIAYALIGCAKAPPEVDLPDPSKPELAATLATYAACLMEAADPDANIKVFREGVKVVKTHDDLAAVYGALAATSPDLEVRVEADPLGEASLRRAQACLTAKLPTVGAVRMNLVRPDLRCAQNLLERAGRTYNRIRYPVSAHYLTLLPDDAPEPACEDKRHLKTFHLPGGDAAAVVVEPSDSGPVAFAIKTRCTPDPDGQCGREGSRCAPTLVSQSDGSLWTECVCSDKADQLGGCSGRAEKVRIEPHSCDSRSMF